MSCFLNSLLVFDIESAILDDIIMTGYERHGFEGVHVCGNGLFLKHSDCMELVQEQVDLSKEWLRKYAKPIDCINTRHSSYGFKHLVETREYISNGA